MLSLVGLKWWLLFILAAMVNNVHVVPRIGWICSLCSTCPSWFTQMFPGYFNPTYLSLLSYLFIFSFLFFFPCSSLYYCLCSCCEELIPFGILWKVSTWLDINKKLMPNGRIMVNCGGAHAEVSNGGERPTNTSVSNGSWLQNSTIKALCQAFPNEVDELLFSVHRSHFVFFSIASAFSSCF